jgi:hypothetical protein
VQFQNVLYLHIDQVQLKFALVLDEFDFEDSITIKCYRKKNTKLNYKQIWVMQFGFSGLEP